MPGNTNSTWQVVVPVSGLDVSDAAPINGSWAVGDVNFFSRNAIARFLQPPNIHAALSANYAQQVLQNASAFAVVRRQGTPNNLRRTVFREMREAAAILAATEAFYGSRHHNSGFTLQGYPQQTAKRDAFIDTLSTAISGNWNQQGMLFPMTLDLAWHTAIAARSFMGVLAAIDGSLTSAVLSFIVDDKLRVENLRRIPVREVESL